MQQGTGWSTGRVRSCSLCCCSQACGTDEGGSGVTRWQSWKQRQIFQVWEISVIYRWKYRLLKAKAATYPIMYWNPSCFSLVIWIRCNFCKINEEENFWLVRLSCIPRINVSVPLIWFTCLCPYSASISDKEENFFVKTCNSIVLPRSYCSICEVSCSYFSSAIQQVAIRLSAYWTGINSLSTSDEDAEVLL